MELKEKLQKIQDNYNKFIEIKKDLETYHTNLKIYDVSYLCYNREKLTKLIQEKFKNRKEDVEKIIEGKNMDNVFGFYCDCRFSDFKCELKDDIGVDFDEVIRLGRTSSFYMINDDLYNLKPDHNDLTQVVYEISENIEEKLEITYGSIKKWIGRWGKRDIKEYIDTYINQSEDLIKKIEKWKKAKDYLNKFKENQEEDFIDFFYSNEMEDDLCELKEERKEKYNEKIAKAIKVRRAHKLEKNKKIVIRIS